MEYYEMEVLDDPKFNFGEIMNKYKHLSVLIDILEQNKDNKEMLREMEKVACDLMIKNGVKLNEEIIPKRCDPSPIMCLATYVDSISLDSLYKVHGASPEDIISHYENGATIKAIAPARGLSVDDIHRIIDDVDKTNNHILIDTHGVPWDEIVWFFDGCRYKMIDTQIIPLFDGRSIIQVDYACAY